MQFENNFFLTLLISFVCTSVDVDGNQIARGFVAINKEYHLQYISHSLISLSLQLTVKSVHCLHRSKFETNTIFCLRSTCRNNYAPHTTSILERLHKTYWNIKQTVYLRVISVQHFVQRNIYTSIAAIKFEIYTSLYICFGRQ